MNKAIISCFGNDLKLSFLKMLNPTFKFLYEFKPYSEHCYILDTNNINHLYLSDYILFFIDCNDEKYLNLLKTLDIDNIYQVKVIFYKHSDDILFDPYKLKLKYFFKFDYVNNFTCPSDFININSYLLSCFNSPLNLLNTHELSLCFDSNKNYSCKNKLPFYIPVLSPSEDKNISNENSDSKQMRIYNNNSSDYILSIIDFPFVKKNIAKCVIKCISGFVKINNLSNFGKIIKIKNIYNKKITQINLNDICVIKIMLCSSKFPCFNDKIIPLTPYGFISNEKSYTQFQLKNNVLKRF